MERNYSLYRMRRAGGLKADWKECHIYRKHFILNQLCIHCKYETPSGTAAQLDSHKPVVNWLWVGTAHTAGGCELDVGIDQLPQMTQFYGGESVQSLFCGCYAPRNITAS